MRAAKIRSAKLLINICFIRLFVLVCFKDDASAPDPPRKLDDRSLMIDKRSISLKPTIQVKVVRSLGSAY